jgi:hypothetical protein
MHAAKSSLRSTQVTHTHTHAHTRTHTRTHARTHARTHKTKADAIANCSAESQSGRDIQIHTDAHPPFIHLLASKGGIFWPARGVNPPPACLPHALSTCQPGLPTDRLSIFSDLDAVMAHMHVRHCNGLSTQPPKLILELDATKGISRVYIVTNTKSIRVSNHQSKIPKTDQGRHYRERHE